MKHYLLVTLGLMTLFLVLFLVVESFGVPVLTDPSAWMSSAGPAAAMVGVGLLIADVLLPVPSSLVMVAHGALFGVWLGTLLSLVGNVGAALFGFAIGRRGGRLLSRLVSDDERARADELLSRWGILAVVVTRPVPILGETVAIVAGTSSFSWGNMTLAAIGGTLPPALLYAITGAAVADLKSSFLVFGVVMLIAPLVWLVGGRGQLDEGS